MKVDIITRHSVPNYGSLLQSYATQKTIEKLGHEAEIINYTRYEERYENLANTLLKGKKWDNNKFTRFIYKFIQTPNYARMYKKFAEYRKDFLRETINEYGNLSELTENIPVSDVYCSGSDQIWGKIGTSEYDPVYFLEFAKNKRCIAYASSFGKTEMSFELNENLDGLLNKYEKILVREDSAKEILKNKGFENVEHVLDPTLLLNEDEWKELSRKARKPKGKYILIYQLHDNIEFDKFAKKFAKKLNFKLIRISPSFYHIKRSGKLVYLPDQYEFLSYFENAEYILTDSFHATVFSIIFNKKFIDILPGKTSTRITSMLKLTNLEDRILNNYNDFSFIDKNIDFTFANDIIKNERDKSIKLLKEAIEGKCRNVDLLNKRYECCGCSTCEKICPTKAIKMKENSEGFLQPDINYEKCINCGACYKKCPQLNEIKNNSKLENQEVYAAKNADENIQKQSSSGGIFSLIANYILDNNGVVFGASLNEKLELEHIKINNNKDLYKLRGSKYAQSNLKDTFCEVKQELDKEKLVLYVGTPCQIAGIKSFLGKEYQNLYLVDLVCHGVPSQKIFKKYLKWLEEKYNSKIIKYEFRNKEKNPFGGIKITFSKKTKFLNNTSDVYYNSFINGKISRESCYNCKYSNENRIGDITISDYWGIEKEHPEFYDEKGVSAIIVNTKQGKKIFSKIKENILLVESNIEKVKRKNQNLIKPTLRYLKRDQVYKNLDNKCFNKIIKENLNYKITLKDIVILILPYWLKNRIKFLIRRKK